MPFGKSYKDIELPNERGVDPRLKKPVIPDATQRGLMLEQMKRKSQDFQDANRNKPRRRY